MSPLIEPLVYNDPPIFYLFSTPGSTIVKRLVWYRLTSNTKRGYVATINFYTSFYTFYNEKSWPTSRTILEEKAATRIYRSTLPKQGQIKPDTVISNLLALKSYHIN